MISRLLNIFVIKARSRPKPTTLPPPFTQLYPGASPPRITQYTITLNPTTRVVLRGLSTDLYALTTTVWLRPKTPVEGYLEAIAKVLVYLVAAVSGNATQAGNLILLSLLLSSAGLLALSNTRVTGLRNGGRVVTHPSPRALRNEKKREDGGNVSGDKLRSVRDNQSQNGPPRTATAGGSIRGYEPRQAAETESWPEMSESSSMAGKDDIVEQRRARNRTAYPLGDAVDDAVDDAVAYELRLEEGLGIAPAKHASETRYR